MLYNFKWLRVTLSRPFDGANIALSNGCLPSGDCKENSTVWFQSFSTHEEPIIGKDSQGRDVYAGILINLFADGTYWGEYYEHAVIERTTDGYRFDPFFETVVQGKWQVIGNKVIVA